jgi:YQGE family putative transporter
MMRIIDWMSGLKGRLFPPVPEERRLGGQAKLSLFIHWSFQLGSTMSAVFLNLYLWRLTESLTVNALYNLILYGLTSFVFVAAGRFVKRKGSMAVIRLGVIVSALFYLLVVLARENVVQYYAGFAVINAVANSLYWTGYLVVMYDVSTPQNRLRYTSLNTIYFTLAGLIGPALAGFIISSFDALTGYVINFSFAFFMFAFTAVVSFRLKPAASGRSRVGRSRFYLRHMGLVIRKNRLYRGMLIGFALYGTFQGLLFFLPNILLYQVLSREDMVGYLNILFSVTGIIAGLYISRYGKDENLRKFLLVSAGGFVLSASMLCFGVHLWTVLAFMVLQSFFTPVQTNPVSSSYYALVGKLPLKGDLLVESVIMREFALNAGRVMSIAALLFFVADDAQSPLLPVLVLITALLQFGWVFAVNRNDAVNA